MTDYTACGRKPQEGSSERVLETAPQTLLGPAQRPGDGGTVQSQLPGDLRHAHILLKVHGQHLLLPGRQLLYPGFAEVAQEPFDVMILLK